MPTLAQLTLMIDSLQAEVARARLDAMTTAAGGTEQSVNQLEHSADQLAAALNETSSAFSKNSIQAELATITLDKYMATQLASERAAARQVQAEQLVGEASARVAQRRVELEELAAAKIAAAGDKEALKEIAAAEKAARAKMSADEGVLRYLLKNASQKAAAVAKQAKEEQEAVEKAEKAKQQASEKSTGAQIVNLQKIMQVAAQLAGVYSLVQTARQALSDAATEDRIQVGLENITGSASQAAKMIQQLNTYSNQSQFDLPQLEGAARLMTSLGFAATEVVPSIVAIGNEIEATGGKADQLENVVKALTRMNDEGQISVFTLRQLEQAGIPAGRLLAQALNESIVEVMKEVRAGTLDAHNTLQILIKAMEDSGNKANSSTMIYRSWNQVLNVVRNTLKDVSLELLRAFQVNNGLQNAIVSIRIFGTGLADVFNVMNGGKAKFEETQTLVNVLSASFRVLLLVLEALVALQLVRWANEFAISLSLSSGAALQLVGVLAALVAIDFGTWLKDNTEGGRDFFASLAAGLKILEAMHKYVGSAAGDVVGGLINDGSSGGAAAALDEDIAKLKDQYNKALKDYNTQVGAPFTPKDGGKGYFDSTRIGRTLKDIGEFIGGGTSSLDLGKLVNDGGKMNQQIREAIAQQSGDLTQLPGQDPNKAYTLSQEKADSVQKQIDKLKEEQALVSDTNGLRKMELNVLKERETIGDKVLRQSQQARDLLAEYVAEYQKLETLKQIEVVAKGLGDAFAKTFGDLVTGAKNGKQALQELLQMIERIAVTNLLEKPLSGLISGGLTKGAGGLLQALGLFGNPSTGGADFGSPFTGNTSSYGAAGGDWAGALTGGGGADFGAAPASASLTSDFAGLGGGAGFAHGAAFWNGIKAFASGDIFSSPTFFGMSGGNLGVMGEDGPEAIVPLSRDSSGKLGIKGGGGSTTTNNYNTNISVSTPDADSFKRSQRQIAAQAQRAFR